MKNEKQDEVLRLDWELYLTLLLCLSAEGSCPSLCLYSIQSHGGF